jgi:hypothetical protein
MFKVLSKLKLASFFVSYVNMIDKPAGDWFFVGYHGGGCYYLKFKDKK